MEYIKFYRAQDYDEMVWQLAIDRELWARAANLAKHHQITRVQLRAHPDQESLLQWLMTFDGMGVKSAVAIVQWVEANP